MFLFIDTTKDITVGIVDSEYQWLEYEFFENAKGSALIHKCIYDQLNKQKKEVHDLKGVIQVAGPGSYTGMRVSEGVSQIFDWQKFDTFSFYHYEVPQLLGKTEGTWFANAFKGEYFLYKWNGVEGSKALIKKNELNINEIENLYTSFQFENFDNDISLTSKLIEENNVELFKEIVTKKIKRPLYYYRTIDQEYTRK